MILKIALCLLGALLLLALWIWANWPPKSGQEDEKAYPAIAPRVGIGEEGVE